MTPIPFRLLGDQVLVEPLRQLERFEEKTASGLLFQPQNPDRDKQREFAWLGRVVLVGPGDKTRQHYRNGEWVEREHPSGGRYPMELKVGDQVMYERRPWAKVTIEGKEYVVLHEEQHIQLIKDNSNA